MDIRTIIIILAILGSGILCLAALWFIDFLKIRQAWAWLFKDKDRRF